MGEFKRDFDRKRSRGRSDRNRPRFGRRDGGRDRGRDRRSGRPEMHSIICDKCGKDCEVPFKPTQGKPIYCNDCFKDRRMRSGSRSEPSQQNNENFDQVNKKLDIILKILGSKKKPVEDKPELKKTKERKKEKEK